MPLKGRIYSLKVTDTNNYEPNFKTKLRLQKFSPISGIFILCTKEKLHTIFIPGKAGLNRKINKYTVIADIFK